MTTAREQTTSHPVHTYSITALDPETGQLGVAVQSHYFSSGSVVPWVEAGVGAVATQAFGRPDYGPEGLALMRSGRSATEALAALLEADPEWERRQVAMVDARGNAAAHTGSRCIAEAGHITGEGFTVQANLMLNSTVWPAMRDAFTSAEGDLANRLLAALEAAQASGGDMRGEQSAALIVASGEGADKPWQGRLFDLRVEDHPHPVEELKRLVRLRRAYQLKGVGDRLIVEGKVEEAVTAYRDAIERAPELTEITFWMAVNLFKVGREEQALARFTEIFRAEPIWADLVPRLVGAGLLPDDAAAIERITSLRGAL
jgi:uncharacterized Ntn-hydrolase superfamily protein